MIELLFIMPPDHKLAGNAHIEATDIVGEDFITYTRVPEPDREYAKFFRPNNSFPNWTETVELPEAIVEMVAAGLGTSVLAGWAVRDSIESGRIVGARVGSDGINIPWYAATRSGVGGNHELNQRVANNVGRLVCRHKRIFLTVVARAYTHLFFISDQAQPRCVKNTRY